MLHSEIIGAADRLYREEPELPVEEIARRLGITLPELLAAINERDLGAVPRLS